MCSQAGELLTHQSLHKLTHASSHKLNHTSSHNASVRSFRLSRQNSQQDTFTSELEDRTRVSMRM